MYEGATWGADSTSPLPTEGRSRNSVQTETPALGDRRVQVNSIRGSATMYQNFLFRLSYSSNISGIQNFQKSNLGI